MRQGALIPPGYMKPLMEPADPVSDRIIIGSPLVAVLDAGHRFLANILRMHIKS
jgi:hypothetical protein